MAEAGNGHDALQLIEQHQPAVVLVPPGDYSIPK
jgi:YesN/AraC family two-component response regulator